MGRGKDYEAVTDEKGNYKVSGVQPGTYRVTVKLPEGTSVHRAEQEVEVSGKGCAQASFWLEPDTRVSGKVVDPAGLPAADVLMELMPIGGNTYISSTSVRSDAEGRYEMKLIAPGRYLLGGRIRRYHHYHHRRPAF